MTLLINVEDAAREALDGISTMQIRPKVWLRVRWSDYDREFRYEWGPHKLTRRGALILIGEMSDA